VRLLELDFDIPGRGRKGNVERFHGSLDAHIETIAFNVLLETWQ